MKIQTVENIIRKAVAYVGIVEGVTNAIHVPQSVRVAITAVAGVLLSVDHFINQPTATTAASAAVSVEKAVTAIDTAVKA